MAGASHIPRFTPGAMSIKADHLNAMLDAIKTHGGDGPGGVVGDSWWGIVVVAPGEEEEYTDARYWVQPMHCTNTEGDETSQPTIGIITETEDDPIYGVVTASNLTEVAASSHSLPVGFPVLVTTLLDEQGPSIERYVFCAGAGITEGASFSVLVWQDGGTTDGDATTQCNRTYTVRTLRATAIDTGGVLLGEGMTPESERPEVGKLHTPTDAAGEIGVGYYFGDETPPAFHLLDAHEVPSVLLSA